MLQTTLKKAISTKKRQQKNNSYIEEKEAEIEQMNKRLDEAEKQASINKTLLGIQRTAINKNTSHQKTK